MLPTQVKCDKEPPTFLLIKSYGLAANERKGTNQMSSIKTKNRISAKKYRNICKGHTLNIKVNINMIKDLCKTYITSILHIV